MIDKKDPKQVSALKNFDLGFLLVFVGFITIILNVLALIGALFLLLGIKDLSESKLRNTDAYKNAYKWTKIMVVVFVVYFIAVASLISYTFFSSFAQLSSAGINSSTGAPHLTQPFSLPIIGIVIMAMVTVAFYLFLQYKFVLALNALAEDSGQEGYRKGARLFYISIFLYILFMVLWAVGFISVFTVINSVSSSISSGNVNPTFFTDQFSFGFITIIVAALSFLAIYILQAIAAYYCYKATENVLINFQLTSV